MIVTSAVPFKVALYLSGIEMSLLLIVIVLYEVGSAVGISLPHAISKHATANNINFFIIYILNY